LEPNGGPNRETTMARVAEPARSKEGEQVTVLKTGEIPVVALNGPVPVGGQTPGTETFAEANEIVLADAAPVIGDATKHSRQAGSGHALCEKCGAPGVAGKFCAECGTPLGQSVEQGPPPEAKKARKFRVLNRGGVHVNDPTGGGRVHLHEGKEISESHYPIRKFQQQGVKLLEITDLDDDAPAPAYDVS
jgi:hypothetical protein